MDRIPDELQALWPDAPVRESDPAGRWVRFAAAGGQTVYLQRYAWDEECMPHYVLAVGVGDGQVEQRRYVRLDEALDQVRLAIGGARAAWAA